MRRGEILGMEWDRHVDLEHGLIMLENTKSGNLPVRPKSQLVPLSVLVLFSKLPLL